MPCSQGSGQPALAWWRFDEGSGTIAADASGNGHQATVVGSPPWKPGIRGSAVALDGFGQYVAVGPGPIIGSAPNFTVEVWINWSGALGLMSIYSEAGPSEMLGLFLEDGRPGFSTFNGAAQSAKSASTLPMLSWHHVAGVLQPGMGGTLYVDGVLISSNPSMMTPAPGVSQTDIGRLAGAGTHFFGGAIDEVRAFSVAKTSQQILDDYRSMGGP
jgi:hypothetical protein